MLYDGSKDELFVAKQDCLIIPTTAQSTELSSMMGLVSRSVRGNVKFGEEKKGEKGKWI